MTRMKDLLGIPFLQNSKIFVQAEDLCIYISITKRKGEIFVLTIAFPMCTLENNVMYNSLYYEKYRERIVNSSPFFIHHPTILSTSFLHFLSLLSVSHNHFPFPLFSCFLASTFPYYHYHYLILEQCNLLQST